MNGLTRAVNFINHIVLLLDASGSMQDIKAEVCKAADGAIAHLAQRSRELEQETRISVYMFSGRGQCECLIFDKDVLRLPSIASLYKVGGQTALIDATIKAIDDLSKTCVLYGDHSFLIYVLTDGEENCSRHDSGDLKRKLQQLPENWTLAAFVPNAVGVSEAKKFGFPAENVQVWQASGSGVKEVGEVIRRTNDAYMQYRSTGQRGFKNLFKLDKQLDMRHVQKALTELHFGQYRIFDVKVDEAIAPFIERALNRPYKLGEAFYELMKPETVQATKDVVIKNRKTHKLYKGPDARHLLGLPDHDVKVAPADLVDWQIFVQSTSVNRKLIGGTSVVVLS